MTVLLLLLLSALIQVHFDDDYGDYCCIKVVPRWVGLDHGSTSSFGSRLGWVWVDEMDPRTTLAHTDSSAESQPLRKGD